MLAVAGTRASYVNPYVSNGVWTQTGGAPTQVVVPPVGPRRAAVPNPYDPRGTLTRGSMGGAFVRPSRFGGMPSQMWMRSRNPVTAMAAPQIFAPVRCLTGQQTCNIRQASWGGYETICCCLNSEGSEYDCQRTNWVAGPDPYPLPSRQAPSVATKLARAGVRRRKSSLAAAIKRGILR